MRRFGLVTLLSAIAIGATLVPRCACAQSGWHRAPLAPAITLREQVWPRTLVTLVLDAHSGAPLPYAQVILRTSPERGGVTDSAGIARVDAVPPGRVAVQVRLIGYHARYDTLEASDSTASVLVVQLRRDSLRLRSPEPRSHAWSPTGDPNQPSRLARHAKRRLTAIAADKRAMETASPRWWYFRVQLKPVR